MSRASSKKSMLGLGMQDAMPLGDEEWVVAHAALVELARKRAGLDFDEGRWLLTARRAEVHRQLGYGSFTEYVERLFGYAPRVTHDKLRVAAALESLPEMEMKLRDGSLSFSQVRELTRVVTPETEQIWLNRAEGCTSRQVEKLVSGRALGSLPDSPADRALERHVLRFEVSGQTMASFREAVAKLRRDAGEHLDDDATLLLLARHVLGGPTDDGRASYQIAIDVCEDCRRARQIGDGAPVDISPAMLETACCDAQTVRGAHVGDRTQPDRATQDVAPTVRRTVLRRDHHRCQVPGCTHATWVDLHHVETRADGGGHGVGNLVTLCGAHHLALHAGRLVIVGNITSGLGFRHADGTPYGAAPSAPQVLVRARAFQALRGLGFGEREARQALAQCLDASAPNAPADDLEAVLRQCLDLLSVRALSRAGGLKDVVNR